ncbi:cation:proton antiporter [Amantichitinum ursilacus]|uniref:K(+)/H(+) antiporter NhaP n=1 Tax=Amantichitinum ursilacus TaxID=857265 RepID=A0A0N0XJM3_9NEIS|nr:cation:proton antiporter [Amantichitinum ursilacus]KPC53926.1 K(+)/H(+) antiporter NhaP [Amantichitinum ursilacus]
MESLTVWWLLIGGSLLFMVVIGSSLKRLPISTATLYLILGIVAGPTGFNLIRLHPSHHAHMLQLACEVALILSLFSAGLKLRLPFTDPRWRIALRLALPTLVLSIVLMALVCVFALGMDLASALLLGAMLAPTDPALASEVTVQNPGDKDAVRFSLTGEAGMNDGVAMPFVVLALAFLLPGKNPGLWSWFGMDIVWGMLGGVGVGLVLGTLVGRGIPYLRLRRAAMGLDEFVALGTIFMAYGLAQVCECNGFLAVFAAGVALRRIEHRHSSGRGPEEAVGAVEVGNEEDAASHPEKAPAWLALKVLVFNEQLEHMAEFAMVFLIGCLLSAGFWSWPALLPAFLLFVVVRPLSVWLGLIGTGVNPVQARLIEWFGIRGVSSLFYISYAINAGLPGPLGERMASIILTTVAISIVAHGLSATPLAWLYERYQNRRIAAGRQP